LISTLNKFLCNYEFIQKQSLKKIYIYKYNICKLVTFRKTLLLLYYYTFYESRYWIYSHRHQVVTTHSFAL